MNKSQLIDALAARFEGNRRDAKHALESVLDTITREIAKGEKVAITGFGSFEKRVRDARWVRNPRTGERIKAKKTAVPKFNAGAELKAVVSGAKKLPKLTATAATGTARAATSTARAAAGVGTKKAAAKKSTAKVDRQEGGSDQEGCAGEEDRRQGHDGEEGARQEGRHQGHDGEEGARQEDRHQGRRRRRHPQRRARPRRPQPRSPDGLSPDSWIKQHFPRGNDLEGSAALSW